VKVSGTESFEVEVVGDNGSVNEGIYGDDDNFTRVRNILYLGAKSPDFDGGLRLDATLFDRPPGRVGADDFVPGGSGYTTLNYDNDYRVERLHGTVAVGDVEATLGDFHVSFGRGMALSLIKMDDLAEDNSLRGGRLTYRIERKVTVDAVGGVVNALNTDPLTRQTLTDDPLDRIIGLRAEWQLLDAVSLGAHGVLVQPRFTDEDAVFSDRLYVDQGPGIAVKTGGGSVEAYLGGVHLYMEGNGQIHDNFRPADEDVLDEPGQAVFGELSYDFTPFSIKGEGIFYRHWLMEGPYRGSVNNVALVQPITYHHMVTLEPLWVPIKSFGNAFGGRLGGEVYWDAADLEVSLKSAFIRYMGGLLPRGTWDDHPKTLVCHPILSLKRTFSKPDIDAGLAGGFRFETTDAPQIAGADAGVLWHLEGDVTVPLGGPHSLALKTEVRRHALEVTEGIAYWVSLVTLGYHLAGLVDVTLAHEYSDELTGEQGKIGRLTWPLPVHHYAWIMGGVDVPRPLDGLRVELFFGSQRGGLKCAGGVCRKYPDGIGMRLGAVYRF
jgi:hypothetical protein